MKSTGTLSKIHLRLELTQAHISSILIPDRWYLSVKMLGLNWFNYRMPHGIPQITRI